MTEVNLTKYISRFGEFECRSMFGGTGLFQNGAMFAVVTDQHLFIRGGDELDDDFSSMGCAKLVHIKKHSQATVNYYDVTEYLMHDEVAVDALIEKSIQKSISQRIDQQYSEPKRLRDLPNMRLTLERMVKKAGIKDVDTFCDLGASEVFFQVCKMYGSHTDVTLLWKFSGAIEGIHWELIQEPKKRELLNAYRAIENKELECKSV